MGANKTGSKDVHAHSGEFLQNSMSMALHGMELRMKTFWLRICFWIELQSAFVPLIALLALYSTNCAYIPTKVPPRYVLLYQLYNDFFQY